MPKPAKKTRDPVGRLYNAVAHYVKKNGGNVVVIGGIAIIRWPSESANQFWLSVKCTGTGPTITHLEKPHHAP